MEPPAYSEHDELASAAPSPPLQPPPSAPEFFPEHIEPQVLVPVGPTLVPEEALTAQPQMRRHPIVAPPIAASFPQITTAPSDRPPLTARIASAPTVRTQPPVDPPTRPATTPAAAPNATGADARTKSHHHHVLQRKRSRKTSATSATLDLPKIEEADEIASQDPTDPLGFTWRLAGPYEVAGPGVSRSKSTAKPDATSDEEGGENYNRAVRKMNKL